jgi:hypothetical protein
MWTIPSSYDKISFHKRIAFMEDQYKYAYLAGLFDGEGTVTLSKNNSSDRFRIPVISISSTTLNLLELCKSTFGGFISTQKVYKEHYKQSWSWKVNYDAAINAAILLIPYIQEPQKKRRLQLIIDHYKEVTPRNGKYTEEMLLIKSSFETEFFHPSNTVD